MLPGMGSCVLVCASKRLPPHAQHDLARQPALGSHACPCRSAKESEDTQGTMDLNMLSGSDWLVAPEDIQLCTRPDGSLHLLGEGGFGTVSRLSHICF